MDTYIELRNLVNGGRQSPRPSTTARAPSANARPRTPRPLYAVASRRAEEKPAAALQEEPTAQSEAPSSPAGEEAAVPLTRRAEPRAASSSAPWRGTHRGRDCHCDPEQSGKTTWIQDGESLELIVFQRELI